MKKDLSRNLEIKKIAVGIALVFSSLAASASENLITFDDLASGQSISNGYAGLNWSNFYSLNGDTYRNPSSGYANGVVSHSNVAYNGYGADASFSAANPFNFHSAYITAAWNALLEVQVTGFLNGVEKYSWGTATYTDSPTLFALDWVNVDRVSFHSYGGFAVVEDYATHFAIDNITISSVPEPESYAMMMAGLGLLAVAASRRKAKQQ